MSKATQRRFVLTERFGLPLAVCLMEAALATAPLAIFVASGVLGLPFIGALPHHHSVPLALAETMLLVVDLVVVAGSFYALASGVERWRVGKKGFWIDLAILATYTAGTSAWLTLSAFSLPEAGDIWYLLAICWLAWRIVRFVHLGCGEWQTLKEFVDATLRIGLGVLLGLAVISVIAAAPPMALVALALGSAFFILSGICAIPLTHFVIACRAGNFPRVDEAQARARWMQIVLPMMATGAIVLAALALISVFQWQPVHLFDFPKAHVPPTRLAAQGSPIAGNGTPISGPGSPIAGKGSPYPGNGTPGNGTQIPGDGTGIPGSPTLGTGTPGGNGTPIARTTPGPGLGTPGKGTTPVPGTPGGNRGTPVAGLTPGAGTGTPNAGATAGPGTPGARGTGTPVEGTGTPGAVVGGQSTPGAGQTGTPIVATSTAVSGKGGGPVAQPTPTPTPKEQQQQKVRQTTISNLLIMLVIILLLIAAALLFVLSRRKRPASPSAALRLEAPAPPVQEDPPLPDTVRAYYRALLQAAVDARSDLARRTFETPTEYARRLRVFLATPAGAKVLEGIGANAGDVETVLAQLTSAYQMVRYRGDVEPATAHGWLRTWLPRLQQLFQRPPRQS